MDIKFDNKIPIYIQIMDLIKRDIVTGRLKGGEKLPSVRELSANLKVNPNTIQRAYQELEREGLTYTQRGTGSFVIEDREGVLQLKKEMAEEVMENFILGMKQIGFNNEEMLQLVSEKLNEEGK